MDRIIRQFKVKRGERDIVYPFTTFPCIFDAKVKGEKLMAYLGQVFTQGIPAGERLSVTSLPELIVKCEKIEDKLTEFAAKADYKGYGNN